MVLIRAAPGQSLFVCFKHPDPGDIKNYIGLDNNLELGGIMAWACWAWPLLFAEVLLQANKTRKFGVVKRNSHGKILSLTRDKQQVLFNKK